MRTQARTRCVGYFHAHARMANLLIVTESMYPSCRLFPGGGGSTNLIGPEIANDISYRLCRSLQRDTCSLHGDTPDFTIVAVNDAHLEATGAVRKEIVGRDIFEAFPDNPDHVDGDGVSNIRASMLRVLQTKRRDVMPIQRYDVPTQGRPEDGFTVRYWKPIHFPILDHQGEVSYIVQHVENVTQTMTDTTRAEEMRTEISVQAQQISSLRDIADLLEQAPVFMAMVSGPEHRFTFVNNGYLKLVGYRDIVGKTVAEGLPEAVDQGYVTLLDQVYLSGEAFSALVSRLRRVPRQRHARGKAGRQHPVRGKTCAALTKFNLGLITWEVDGISSYTRPTRKPAAALTRFGEKIRMSVWNGGMDFLKHGARIGL